jgi:hypothetical protein
MQVAPSNVPHWLIADAGFLGSLRLASRFPLAEWDESVANPNVVRDCFNQGDLLNQPVVGKLDQALVLGIIRGLEAVSNDPGHEGYGFDIGHRALKVAAYLAWL